MYFNIYIMIVKFKCLNSANVLEVEKEDDYVIFSIEDQDEMYSRQDVVITKDNLFSLIGQLLRLQSELKNK